MIRSDQIRAGAICPVPQARQNVEIVTSQASRAAMDTTHGRAVTRSARLIQVADFEEVRHSRHPITTKPSRRRMTAQTW